MILLFVNFQLLAEVIVSNMGEDGEDRTHVIMFEDSGKATRGRLERREDI